MVDGAQLRMRRSSSIRCLSIVMGETSVTDDNIKGHWITMKPTRWALAAQH
jgi:hypothetical protein